MADGDFLFYGSLHLCLSAFLRLCDEADRRDEVHHRFRAEETLKSGVWPAGGSSALYLNVSAPGGG